MEGRRATMAIWESKLAVAALLLLALSTTASSSSCGSERWDIKKHVYIGGYSDKIVLAYLQGSKLDYIASFESVNSPSFLALHPEGNFLYSVGETENGMLQAFSINSSSGFLTALNNVSSGGSAPAHISVHRTGKWLFFANYNGHSFGSIAILPNGSLASSPISLITAHGHGPNSGRQEAPHPHQIITDPSGKYAFVSDLGSDKIYQLTVSGAGKLAPNPAAAEVRVHPAGSGPRDLIFRCPFVYGINELGNSVTLYSFDEKLGTLKQIKSWSTLDGSVKNSSLCTAAELGISEDKNYLYASNRCSAEASSIAVFKITPFTGELVLLGLRRFADNGPRDFGVDPGDKAGLVVAFQYNNTVGLYGRNFMSGEIGCKVSSIDDIQIQSPTCVAFSS